MGSVPTRQYYQYQPSVGLAAGYFNQVSAVHKFGRNEDVGTAWETLWSEGALYVYPAAATVMQVSSSSAADASPSGTGARTVELEGLDANYDVITETVALNGQTQVPTIKLFLRANRARVLTVGTGLKNAGSVYTGVGTPTTGKPATVYAVIEPELNQTLMGLYTIPRGHRAHMLHSHFSSSVAKKVSAGIFARAPGEVFQIKEYGAFISGVADFSHDTADIYPAKTDIEGRAKVSVAGGDIACQFELALIQDNT